MSFQYPNPHEIVAKGSDIYERRYRTEFERLHRGEFAAIDINSEAAYLADLPEKALSKARAAAQEGLFYLVRVGSSRTFKSSRMARGVAHAR
jgi:alpha-galactosidase